MVKIRLTRGGRIHKPIYTIVAADSRRARDGRFLERLGQYTPGQEPELSQVNVDSIKKWKSQGAQISDTLNSLFKRNNISLN